MSIGVFYLKSASDAKVHIRIGNLEKLTSNEAILIRNEVRDIIETGFTKIYIDAKDVKEATLCGINEIIHTNFWLAGFQKTVVFIYRKNSLVEKWVDTTGLNRFVETAIIPA